MVSDDELTNQTGFENKTTLKSECNSEQKNQSASENNHALHKRIDYLEQELRRLYFFNTELLSQQRNFKTLEREYIKVKRRPFRELLKLSEFRIARKLNKLSKIMPISWQHNLKNVLEKRNPQHLPYEDTKYQNWVSKNEARQQLSPEKRVALNKKMGDDKVFSIVVPIICGDKWLIDKALRSILTQSYTKFELFLVYDHKTAPVSRSELHALINKEGRVKLLEGDYQGQFSFAQNEALAQIRGDYVLFVHPDGFLHQDALLFLADAFYNHPHAKILYSDEDRVDAGSVRSSPCFKPDFNREYLYSTDYIGNLRVYTRDLVEKNGAFSQTLEAACDYDFLLRAILRVEQAQIIHVPRVLFHEYVRPQAQQADETRVRGGLSSQDFAAHEALRNHLDALGFYHAEIENNLYLEKTYRIRWPLPHNKEPKVTLIMPTRDMLDVLKVAVLSVLARTLYDNYELVIVDNGSVKAETLTWLKEIEQQDQRVRVLRHDIPFNYSELNNFAAAQTSGDVIGLLNNDMEVISPDWLHEMVSLAIRPDIGCVGAKLYYPNGMVQHAGVIIGICDRAAHSHRCFSYPHLGVNGRLAVVQEYSAVTGACLVLRRAIYEEVGGLDAKNLSVAFNDIDLCLKTREAGYRNLWTPFSQFFHYELISRGSDEASENKARFMREFDYMTKRWAMDTMRDPFYSVNFTHTREDFSIADVEEEIDVSGSLDDVLPCKKSPFVSQKDGY